MIRSLISGLSNNTESYTFLLQKFIGPNSYDLSRAFLSVDVALVDKNDAWLSDDVKVSVCDNVVSSCFSQLKISLNEVDCYNCNFYAHWAYIAAKCSLNKSAHESYLEIQGLTGDDGKKMCLSI